ncbi:MAG: YSC84-related protein [Nitrospirales bacterium]
MKKAISILCIPLAVFLLAGCGGPKGANPDQKRQAVRDMAQETIMKLHKIEPQAKTDMDNAVGYAAFSNTGINLLLLSTGNGWGIAHDNETVKETYIKMFSAGVGVGLGVKDFRGVFIFKTREAFDSFVESGWQAGAQADAAAKAGEKGGAAAGAIDVAPGVKLYQITESGLALQATIQGTKYWKDDELNK